MKPTIEQQRPDPEEILRQLHAEEERSRKGRLKIFFGMCAGVGKTYDMLVAGREAQSKGTNLLVGYVETHGRKETEALLEGLPLIPRKSIEYRGVKLEEMDLDGILVRKPALVLVDELAHTNAPGSRHAKRFQDVLELLDSGIDVYTTLNVQHLESRADTVAQITGSVMRETVPDSIFEQADDVEIIDIPPDELLRRLQEGKVYTPERSQQAIRNFFQVGHLTALREMSLRLTAERVDHQLRSYMRRQRISGPWKSGQRILVGISPSPESVKLIRWARRMAYTMNATWIAVYVEQRKQLSDAGLSQLEHNLKLARELGAEIITTAEDDVAGALLRIARQENAGQILIGKTSAKRIFFWRTPVLDRLVEESGDLDVYVVGGEEMAGKRPRRFAAAARHSSPAQYAIAALVILFVVLICYPFSSLIGYQTVSFIILFAVSILPLRLGIGPVFTAATLGALLWDLFFIPPVFTFSITKPVDILMLGMYFLVAIVTGVLSARTRAQERAVRARERRTAALYTLTRDLSNASTQDGVIAAAVADIHKFFDADTVVYLSQPDGDLIRTPNAASSMTPDEKDFSVAAWVYWNERKAGKFTDTLPFANATYYALSGPRYALGVIGIRPRNDERFSIDQETLLENCIRQIASTLERELLNELTGRAVVAEESERLYKTLFNSISHEIRTPIAAILGASENLEQAAAAGKPPLAHELLGEIHVAAERLDRLVGNLLNMARLESGRVQPKPDWSDVQDLIGSSLKTLKKELGGREVRVEVSPVVPLLKIDFALIEQVLVNIIHNMAEYTPAGTPIEVQAIMEGNDCIIALADHGPGIPPAELKKIFDKFYRLPGSKTGGIGLGLSIAKGFVEAHKGTLVAENRRDGTGLRFLIRLPVEPAEELPPAT